MILKSTNILFLFNTRLQLKIIIIVGTFKFMYYTPNTYVVYYIVYNICICGIYIVILIIDIKKLEFNDDKFRDSFFRL